MLSSAQVTRSLVFLPLMTVLASYLISCSSKESDTVESPPPAKPVTESLKPGSLQIVSSSGLPIVGAQVLIGDSENKPFTGNIITTDEFGGIVPPALWTQALPVTIVAKGFIKATYMAQTPHAQILVIKPVEGPKNLELSGQTLGFQVKNYDGLADFGLTIPTLSRQDLFNFDLGMVISSQFDKISVYGQSLSVPSNLSLPKQKETYMLPITLQKSDYHLFFSQPGVKTIYSARGQFPFKKVIDSIRKGQNFVDLINEIKIYSGGLRSIDMKGPHEIADMSVADMAFNQSHSFTVPALKNGQVLLGVAIAETKGVMVPTDFKKISAPGKSNLSTTANTNPFLLTVLKNQNEFQSTTGQGRISATLLPFKDGVAPLMLPLMNDPKLNTPTNLHIDPLVAADKSIYPTATYLVLSEITQGNVATTNHIWEVYDSDWKTDYQLPQWPNAGLPSGPLRWEISRIGSIQSINGTINGKKLDLGPAVFEHSTHATHSSIDF